MDKGADMHLQKPRFDWTFNFGHLLQTAGTLVGIGALIWQLAQNQAEMRRDIVSLQAQATKYVPMVEAFAQSQSVQDERIGSLSSAVQDIRKTNGELLSQFGAVREDLAGIKARINTGGVIR